MTKTCPDCHADILSTSQPNRMGTTPAQEDLYERFDVDDDYAYRFQYADGSAFQIYADGRAYIMAKDGSIRDKPKGVVTNRIPMLIGSVAKPRQDRIEELEAQIAALAATPAVGILSREHSDRVLRECGYETKAATPAVGGEREVLRRIIDTTHGVDSSAVCWLRLEKIRNIAYDALAQPAYPLRGREALQDEARKLVTDWLGWFSPPPQIDIQQSEFLQAAIVEAMKWSASPPEQPAADPVTGRDQLRKLVDIVWNEATESKQVPSTKWADRMIDRAFPAAPETKP